MYQDEYKRWLEADLIDCDLKTELQNIAGDDDARTLQGMTMPSKSALRSRCPSVPQVSAVPSAQAQTA